jgi:UDP-glucose:(heptosyl)LPS alpha-1,3-glucosyltransferase
VKLALVVRRLSTDGGTERFVHGLAGHLVAHEHQVHVWCLAVDKPVEGVFVHLQNSRARGRVWKLRALGKLAEAVPRREHDRLATFARTPGADLYRAGGGCHQAWLERRDKTPIASRLIDPADRLELSMDRAAATTAGMVVVNSELAGQDLREHYGLDEGRIHLVRNGVDLIRFSPAGPVDPRVAVLDGPVVGFVGNGFARKGLRTAIEVVARSDAHLVVVGRDPRPAHYARLAERLGMAERFHLLGVHDAPEQVLRGCSAFVLPTRYDSCANACLEAMACGVPVITSATNGACEVLPEPWQTIERADDTSGFANSLERALQDEGLRARSRVVAEALPASRAFRVIEELLERA